MKKFEIIYEYVGDGSIPDSNKLISVKWASNDKKAKEFLKKKKHINILEVNEIPSTKRLS